MSQAVFTFTMAVSRCPRRTGTLFLVLAGGLPMDSGFASDRIELDTIVLPPVMLPALQHTILYIFYAQVQVNSQKHL